MELGSRVVKDPPLFFTEDERFWYPLSPKPFEASKNFNELFKLTLCVVIERVLRACRQHKIVLNKVRMLLKAITVSA